MTIITQTDIGDITGMDDNRSWTFCVQQMRESDSGTGIVTPKKDRKYPIAGVLTVELDPGPAVVLAPDGKTYPFTVPDTDSELWPLIQAAVTIPPSTTHQQLLDAVDAWLDSHTNVWDVLPGRPASLVAGANVANGYAGLDGTGKIGTAQLPISAMEYKGNWNASTNSPTLADGTGSAGDVYRVATSGSRNLGSGSLTFAVNDSIIYNGSTWEKSGPAAPVIFPETYGAVGNGSTDDAVALNAMYAASAGKTVWLDPSKTYAHNDVVTIGQDGTVVSGGGTLKATNAAAQKSAVIVTGDNVVLDHVHLTCPTASTRRGTLEDCKLALNQCDGAIIRNVTIDGSSNFGLIVFGATNFHIDRPDIKNTMADGLHATYGSAHGVITAPSTDTTGDDGIAVVSYGTDGAACDDIRITGFKVKNSAARGINVDGGTNIRYFDGAIDGTVGAAIIVECEAAFATYGVSDVVVANVDVANANSGAPGVDQGAVTVYNDRATGFDIEDVTITDIRVRDTAAGATHQINILNLSSGNITGIELGPMTFTGTGPSAILNTSGVKGAADIGFNADADYIDNIAPKSVPVKSFGFVAGSAEYRLLGNLPIDDSGNVSSLSLAGRIGGWTSSGFAQWQILLSNRSDANDGITVNSAVFGQGQIANALAGADIVVYAHVDKSASVYIKHPVGGFYSYDFDARAVQGTVNYTGATSTTVPTGTLVWSLSTAPKLAMDTAGATQISSIELGNASDTTIARSSAGNITVEGNALYRAGGTDVPVADGGTGRSTSTTAYGVICAGTSATAAHQTTASAGAAGQILRSGGASALPAWGNKARVNTTASSATPSISCDTTDQYTITALAVAITGVTITGTPTDGQGLVVRIKDNGTARAITWGASFQAGPAALLTTTAISKTHRCYFEYDSAVAKWVAVMTDATGY